MTHDDRDYKMEIFRENTPNTVGANRARVISVAEALLDHATFKIEQRELQQEQLTQNSLPQYPSTQNHPVSFEHQPPQEVAMEPLGADNTAQPTNLEDYRREVYRIHDDQKAA